MEKFISTLLEWYHQPNTTRLITIAIGVAVIVAAIYSLKRLLSKTIKTNDNRYRARKAANFFGYILVVVLALFVYSDKLGNIGVALGVAGAGIAFALQEVILSIAGWFGIVVMGIIGVGQRVKIGDVKGDVIDVGVLTSTIMETGDWVQGDLYNGRIVTVANSFVFKQDVHNYSGEYPFLWDEIEVPIRTESDHQAAKLLFQKVLEDVCGEYAKQSESVWSNLSGKYMIEAAQVSPMVTLQFNENWITFTLRYVVDYKKRRSTKDLIFTKILNEIKQGDGTIMIATGTLEVTNAG